MPELTSAGYREMATLLAECLTLRQPPVAVSFADQLPGHLAPNAGRAPAGCRFWQDGAQRTIVTSAADHSLCAIGVYTHNLAPSPAQQVDLTDALEVFAGIGYVRNEDLASIPVLNQTFQYVIYAPLAEAPLPPDVVLLFVNASDTLILSEAAQQVELHHPLAMGRPACAVIAQARNSGRAVLSLGCCGARAYLDILTDDIALFAIPGPKLEAYAARIEALAEANSLLAKYHQLRRRDIDAGAMPTVKESLAALRAAG